MIKGLPLLASIVVLAAACGVPTQSEPVAVDPTLVPNQLLSGQSPEPRSIPALPTGERTVSYFVEEDRLVAVQRAADGGTRRDHLRHALRTLLGGPTVEEQAEGLSTSLPPELGLSVASIDKAEATIDLADQLRNLPTSDLIVAVAQIVLTATAVPGVESVRLTQRGRSIEAPLIDGSRTADPLTAATYQTLLARSPTTTPSTGR